MFKFSNVAKKFAVAVASVALVLPLTTTSVFAHTNHKIDHVRTERITKRPNMNTYNNNVEATYSKHANHNFKKGLSNALNSKLNKSLEHNNSYINGYLRVIILDNFTAPTGNKKLPKLNLNRTNVKNAMAYYNDCIIK